MKSALKSGSLSVALVLAVSPVWAQGTGTSSDQVALTASAPVRTLERSQVERKLQSTKTLLESSTGAKQIAASQVAQAQATRQEALALHGTAEAAFAAGDMAKASAMLDQASMKFFAAVRLAAPEQVTGAKQQQDFDARMNSTKTLLDAQKRIAQEKSAGPRAAELSKRIESMMQEADGMAKAGKVAEGRKVLDEAYLAVKAAIGGMRGGETMVRSLNFASKEEEYHYEVDRNETHKMLVQVLLKDRRSNTGVDELVQKALAAAAELRAQGDKQAAQKDHAAAVKSLEESTKELVKAIRGAGVYIPG